MASTPLHILAIAGSLRAASLNRGLLRAARELAPQGMEIRLFDLADVPLYNAGRRGARANPARDRGAQGRDDRETDGLLIATPEYNYGVPGVLKNAIDSGLTAARLDATQGQAGRAHGRVAWNGRDGARATPAPPGLRLHATPSHASTGGPDQPRDRQVRRAVEPDGRGVAAVRREYARSFSRVDTEGPAGARINREIFACEDLCW